MGRRGKLGNAPGSDIHLTPPEVWERVERVAAGPVFDPCPHPFTVDGLEGPWPLESQQMYYCNPPFSDLLSWSIKVARTAARGHAGITLVPVRTSQPYWTELCEGAVMVAFWTGDKDRGGTLARRVRYLDQHGVRQAGAPFDTALFLHSTSLLDRVAFRRAFEDVATVVQLRVVW